MSRECAVCLVPFRVGNADFDTPLIPLSGSDYSLQIAHTVFLPPSIVDALTVDDFAPDSSFEIGVLKDGVIHIEWSGRFIEDGAWSAS